jgi:hypothetical protein
VKHIINKIIKRFDSSAANTRQAFARRGEWQLKIFRFHISLANPTGRGNEKKKCVISAAGVPARPAEPEGVLCPLSNRFNYQRAVIKRININNYMINNRRRGGMDILMEVITILSLEKFIIEGLLSNGASLLCSALRIASRSGPLSFSTDKRIFLFTHRLMSKGKGE